MSEWTTLFTASQTSWLKSNSYTKVVCPFGLACVGTAGYPDAFMKECAGLLASLIDIDRDGVVDDAELQKAGASTNSCGIFALDL